MVVLELEGLELAVLNIYTRERLRVMNSNARFLFQFLVHPPNPIYLPD